MLLAIDTATPAGSVAIASDDQILAVRTFDAPREHSARLFQEIDAVMSDAGCTPAQTRAVAVTTGPGSFTGLRIGLSAAKGLCMGLDIPLIPVSTLEALAARVPYCRLPICTLLDARRGEVYAALYDTSAGLPRQLQAPCALAPEQLLALWPLEGVLFTGDGTTRWADLLTSVQGARLAPGSVRRPCADAVAWLASQSMSNGQLSTGMIDAALVEPYYLRTPDFVPAASHASGRPGVT